jgi:hypothetical protein
MQEKFSETKLVFNDLPDEDTYPSPKLCYDIMADILLELKAIRAALEKLTKGKKETPANE